MLSWLAGDFFAKSPVLLFPLVALVVFFTVFMGVSLRVALTRKNDLDRLARLPFADEAQRPELTENDRTPSEASPS